jgi:hypothetical protein
MNKLLLLISILVTFTYLAFAQDLGREENTHKRRAPLKKIEELEKIKLLDALKLDESVAAKLITRRNVNRTKIWDIEDKISIILKNIESEIRKEKEKDNSKIQKLNEDYLILTMEVDKERVGFVKSLSDILTPEQVGKYIVFERKFREEIRELLMKERMRRNKDK